MAALMALLAAGLLCATLVSAQTAPTYESIFHFAKSRGDLSIYSLGMDMFPDIALKFADPTLNMTTFIPTDAVSLHHAGQACMRCLRYSYLGPCHGTSGSRHASPRISTFECMHVLSGHQSWNGVLLRSRRPFDYPRRSQVSGGMP